MRKKEEKVESKNHFVPSYQNKTTDKRVEEKTKKVKGQKVKSKLTYVLIGIFTFLLIAAVVLLMKKFSPVSYGKYDKWMEDYGYSVLYDNHSVNPKEKVTYSEALKMILGVTYNVTDITQKMPDSLLYETHSEDLGSYSDYIANEDGSINFEKIMEYNQKLKETKVELTEAYSNEYWVRYANSIDLFNGMEEITEKNANRPISVIEVIRYLGYAKSTILGKTLDTSFEPQYKDYHKYTNEEKMAIADLAYNQIIEDSKTKLKAHETLTKAKLNELMINYVLKYNLITVGEEKVNINEEKMPNNQDDYPYTLANVNKTVYEIPMYQKNEGFKTPKQIFLTLKETYEQINEEVEAYYNAVLNVNYETIDNEEFFYAISNFYTDSHQLKNYIQYVKENKIKVEGNAKVQNPILYFDGEDYRVRVKLEYEVKEGATLSNVLYGDVDTSYKLAKEIKYIDLPIYVNSSYHEISIKLIPIDQMIAGQIAK